MYTGKSGDFFNKRLHFDKQLKGLLGIPPDSEIKLPASGAKIMEWVDETSSRYPDLERYLRCLFTLPPGDCGSLFTGADNTVIPCWWSGFWIEKFATSDAFQQMINQVCNPEFGKDAMRPCGNCDWNKTKHQPTELALPPPAPLQQVKTATKEEKGVQAWMDQADQRKIEALQIAQDVRHDREGAKAALFKDWDRHSSSAPSASGLLSET